jgi:hypothetical protein
MIYFKFVISNPWHKSNDNPQKDYIVKEWVVSKNKFVDLQLTKWSSMSDFVDINLDLRWFGQDHAGLSFDITLFGYFFNIALRDMRHWNWEEGRFMNEAEIQADIDEWKEEQAKRETKSEFGV